MELEWFRDLSITVFGFVGTIIIIVVAILFLRLYRVAKIALAELRIASILAHDTAAAMHDGMQPVFDLLAMVRGIRDGLERSRRTYTRRR